jgi:hypothetical protein
MKNGGCMSPENPFDQEMDPETVVSSDTAGQTGRESVKPLKSIEDFKANLARLSHQDLQMLLRTIILEQKQL